MWIPPSGFFSANDGGAVYRNDDDASGTSLRLDFLAAGNALGPQVAGLYYLAISLSGNEPINFANQLMFLMSGGLDRLARSKPDRSWGLNNFDPSGVVSLAGGSYPYRIDLTGAQTSAVPEPATLALGVLGGLSLLALNRRRRAKSNSASI